MAKNREQDKEQETEFSVKDFLFQCLAHWPKFLCSILILLGIGYLYILRQPPVYTRTCQVLIQDNSGDPSSAVDAAGAFSSLGFLGSNAQVNNEVIAMKSPAVMTEVVERLDLTMNYAQKIHPLHRTTLYGTDLPVRAKFLNLDLQDAAGFRMILHPNGSFELDKFYQYVDGKKKKFDFETTGRIGTPVKSPVGSILIEHNPVFAGKLTETVNISIGKGGFHQTVENYMKRLKADLVNDEAEVIELGINDTSTQRAVDVLNTVVAVYNEEWVNDKRKVSTATSKFINERLAILEKELGEVDTDIFSYKSEHGIPDVKSAAELFMTQSARQDEEIQNVTNRLAVTGYLRDYLLNPANKYQVLPVNTGIESPQLEIEIGNYNSMLLARNSIADNSSATNPLVEDYDARLKGMRESVLKSVNVQLANLQTTLQNMRKAKGENDSKISNTPTQAKYLISIERKQEVMESLYLFLLQKREETQLQQAFTNYNTRLIAPPYGPLKPVSPKVMLIMVVCFVLGVAIPGVYYYLDIVSDTKVHNRKDVANINVPFAGEIPLAGKVKKRGFIKRTLDSWFKKKRETEYVPLRVVADGKRDAVNEAFRVVRNNMEFILDRSLPSHVVMVTSLNPASGKSFVTFNLGLSMALKHNKVLLVEGDMRHGSLSTYAGSPTSGLSDYLTGRTSDWHSLVTGVDNVPGFDIIPMGKMPPNPAELLDNGRIETLIEQARNDYEYILIDCPPINMVADAQIINRYADATLFVIRAGVFDKSSLSEIEKLRETDKLKNISILINGIEDTHTDQYSDGYYGGAYISE